MNNDNNTQLIGFATVMGLFVNVYAISLEAFEKGQVTMQVKNAFGRFVDLDSRYYTNLSEFTYA